MCWKAEARVPWREAALEAFRRRNAILDAIFYDIGKITGAEAAKLSPWLAAEGTILIVPPSGTQSVSVCVNEDDFASKGGADIRALAVAGVGSSALGSAAFARNVADAFGEPVAAVVSGYGLADLVTEAAGGWFWFGTLNSLRHEFEILDQLTRNADQMHPFLATSAAPASLGRLSLDTRTVGLLLSDKRFQFSLLTGHSKGNLVISEALYELNAAAKKPRDDTWLVTISAVIAMPPRFTRIIDVIGQLDWFGALNSRLDLGVEDRPPLAWHHTNTELPLSLHVTDVFRDLTAKRGIRLR